MRLTLLAALAPIAIWSVAGASDAAPARSSISPYRSGIDVVDYEFAITLPERGDTIAVQATISLRRTARVDTLILDLLAPMRVSTVRVLGEAAPFTRDSATVRIALPPGERDSLQVRVEYRGAPRDGLIIRTDSLGRWIAFGDNFPDRGRNWLATVDHPSDKATVTFDVNAPSERRVVANGALVEETPIADTPAGRAPRTHTRWRESRPVPVYVMVIAAAPLARYELGRTACGLSEMPGCVPQTVYVAPEVRDFLPGPFTHAAEIVEFFSTLVAPFPYEKLAHLQTTTRFGGMENSSAIFYADQLFRRRTMSAGLIAHETAHQWFGDAVTEREWGHLWLSEGFATYWQQLWVERFQGDSAMRAERSRTREEIIKSPVTATRPVLDTAQTEYLKLLNTNSYQKGAWTLHMLRRLVGDSAFFRGVRGYYLAHRHGNALTDDLRREVERTSGQRLEWFFDQWLTRPGYAELAVAWRWDASARRVVLTVDQGERFAPYRLPLTVEIRDADGTTRRASVELAAIPHATVAVPLVVTSRPVSIVFDPDVDLLATVRTR